MAGPRSLSVAHRVTQGLEELEDFRASAAEGLSGHRDSECHSYSHQPQNKLTTG